jgi:hypothetical protein
MSQYYGNDETNDEMLAGQDEIQIRCLLRENRYQARETEVYIKEIKASQEYLKEKEWPP